MLPRCPKGSACDCPGNVGRSPRHRPSVPYPGPTWGPGLAAGPCLPPPSPGLRGTSLCEDLSLMPPSMAEIRLSIRRPADPGCLRPPPRGGLPPEQAWPECPQGAQGMGASFRGCSSHGPRAGISHAAPRSWRPWGRPGTPSTCFPDHGVRDRSGCQPWMPAAFRQKQKAMEAGEEKAPEHRFCICFARCHLQGPGRTSAIPGPGHYMSPGQFVTGCLRVPLLSLVPFLWGL